MEITGKEKNNILRKGFEVNVASDKTIHQVFIWNKYNKTNVLVDVIQTNNKIPLQVKSEFRGLYYKIYSDGTVISTYNLRDMITIINHNGQRKFIITKNPITYYTQKVKDCKYYKEFELGDL
jgi:hypothetical protein